MQGLLVLPEDAALSCRAVPSGSALLAGSVRVTAMLPSGRTPGCQQADRSRYRCPGSSPRRNRADPACPHQRRLATARRSRARPGKAAALEPSPAAAARPRLGRRKRGLVLVEGPQAAVRESLVLRLGRVDRPGRTPVMALTRRWKPAWVVGCRCAGLPMCGWSGMAEPGGDVCWARTGPAAPGSRDRGETGSRGLSPPGPAPALTLREPNPRTHVELDEDRRRCAEARKAAGSSSCQTGAARQVPAVEPGLEARLA